MSDRDQELLVQVLKQGVGKLTKAPEQIPVDFDQRKMYADEAAHRQSRSQRKRKKK